MRPGQGADCEALIASCSIYQVHLLVLAAGTPGIPSSGIPSLQGQGSLPLFLVLSPARATHRQLECRDVLHLVILGCESQAEEQNPLQPCLEDPGRPGSDLIPTVKRCWEDLRLC